jgi:VanZ family protein
VKLVEAYAGGRFLRLLFWAAALFALVMALLPPAEGPSFLPDKVQHAIAFGTLGLLGLFAYPRWNAVSLIASLSLFGALIEILQGTSFIARDADPLDWITDTIACAVVVVAIRWWTQRKP